MCFICYVQLSGINLSGDNLFLNQSNIKKV